MIPNFKTYLKESVWGDIRKKSLGQESRTENDINNMTFEQFVRFIQDRYDVLEQPAFFHIGFWVDSTNTGVLSVPLERNRYEETPNRGNRMLKVEMDISTNEYMCIMPNIEVFEMYPRELQDTFGDKYDLDVSAKTITPKNGTFTNGVVLDVIDKLINMMDYPLLKKKK